MIFMYMYDLFKRMQKNSLQEIADVHIKSVNQMDMCELFMLLQVFVFSWKRKDPEKDKRLHARFRVYDIVEMIIILTTIAI